MKEQKIKYGDLNLPLKVFVVIGWIVFGLYALLFLAGFVMGVAGL